ncbi:energy transducer TonB [Neptunomonas marina]|uniref:Protein TonB n=1 Tax=Neptunomonas marina TaxID=1815562 RepID=A0A437Q535_9GAMM|nr:TonB family protein [Neptunomonas marina]RVU29617.1 energy transducer TonB [Neptunomonas marina]
MMQLHWKACGFFCSLLLHLGLAYLLWKQPLLAGAAQAPAASFSAVRVSVAAPAPVAPAVAAPLAAATPPEPIIEKPKPKPAVQQTLPTHTQVASGANIVANKVQHQASVDAANEQQRAAPPINPKAQRDLHFNELAARIDAHKHYPSRARKRGIEGRVTFIVSIDASGNLADVEWLKGNRLFYKSTLQAIQRSLPLPSPLGAVAYKLTLVYQLK